MKSQISRTRDWNACRKGRRVQRVLARGVGLPGSASRIRGGQATDFETSQIPSEGTDGSDVYTGMHDLSVCREEVYVVYCFRLIFPDAVVIPRVRCCRMHCVSRETRVLEFEDPRQACPTKYFCLWHLLIWKGPSQIYRTSTSDSVLPVCVRARPGALVSKDPFHINDRSKA